MPTNARGMKIKGSYTPSKYQAQLKKLEAKVGRASTPQARKKAQDAVRAFKRTRSKYYEKNPTSRAVRRAGTAVKKTAKKVVRKAKTTAKKAASAYRSANARAQASGAVNKRRAIEKLEARLNRTNDPFKKREIRKELTAARKAKANVFAKARGAKITKSKDNLKKGLVRGGAIHSRVRAAGIRAGQAMSSAGSPPPPTKKKTAKKKTAKKKTRTLNSRTRARHRIRYGI